MHKRAWMLKANVICPAIKREREIERGGIAIWDPAAWWIHGWGIYKANSDIEFIMLHAIASHTIRMLESNRSRWAIDTIRSWNEYPRWNAAALYRRICLRCCAGKYRSLETTFVARFILGRIYVIPQKRSLEFHDSYARPFLRPLNCSGSFSESRDIIHCARAHVPQKYSIEAIHLQIEWNHLNNSSREPRSKSARLCCCCELFSVRFPLLFIKLDPISSNAKTSACSLSLFLPSLAPFDFTWKNIFATRVSLNIYLALRAIF